MQELNFEQMECINGGGWLSEAWDWVQGAGSDVWDWIVESVISYFGNQVDKYWSDLRDLFDTL